MSVDINHPESIIFQFFVAIMINCQPMKLKPPLPLFRNQWFRTRMVTFLRQIVRATFGGKINLKIQEYVEWLTSPEYISEMITLFK
jgi:hypothetical protein